MHGQADPHPRHTVEVLDSKITYVDVPSESEYTAVFVHGNPTSSYLWRNVIPHVKPVARCLAPDLIGMGASGKNPSGSYRFVDHYRYFDAWMHAMGLHETGNVVFVIHDWGSALGFHWAQQHQDAVAGIAYMEALVMPVSWDDWPERARNIFQAMRSAAGEEIVLEKNVFVERILPASVIRDLTEEEMGAYRAPYLAGGESRRPTLTWPREIPIDGDPPDVHTIVSQYGEWLEQSELPKLFIRADPGTILMGRQRDYCRTWPNQTEVTVKGLHFIQEDSPEPIGQAVAEFVESLGQ